MRRPGGASAPPCTPSPPATIQGLTYSPRVPATDPQAPAPGYYPPSYEPQPAHKPPAWKRAGAIAGAAALVLLKFGAKLKVLLLLLPKLKLFTTSASMLVSIAAYSLIWGWSFALGFVLLLLVHEMGHVLQLRREGIKGELRPCSSPSSAPWWP